MFQSVVNWHKECPRRLLPTRLPFLLFALLIIQASPGRTESDFPTAPVPCCISSNADVGLEPLADDSALDRLQATAGEAPASLAEPQQPESACDAIETAPPAIEDPDLSQYVRPGNLAERARRLAEAGLLLLPLDGLLMRRIPRIASGHDKGMFVSSANKLGTPAVLLPVIGGLHLLGDDHDKTTAKLALAALINSAIATNGLKILAGRGRPSLGSEAGEFEGIERNKGRGYSSFPSGHTSSAFALAAVLANRYPKHKWTFYGLASAVGIARIRSSAHFPSDVLVGAGIGTYAGYQALSHGFNILSYKIKL